MPALDRLLQRCLAKDPDDRWQSAHDLKVELEWIASASGEVTTVPAVTRHRLLPWIAAAVAIAVAGGALAGWYRMTRPAELKALVRLGVDLGPDVSLGSPGGADAILSPDGTRLVYVSKGKLFTRKLDQPKATELAGTEGAYAPFFSPEGQWVGFFSSNGLRNISVEGGAAIVLSALVNTRGGSWGEEGNIIVALNNIGVLSRIPPAGGSPVALTELALGELTHRWPEVLPGAKAVLFTANATLAAFDSANIEVMSLGDRRWKTLVRGGTFGHYLLSGHLVYVNRGTLFAVPFDLDKRGGARRALARAGRMAYASGEGFAQFDASRSGTLLYRSGGATGGGLVTVQGQAQSHVIFLMNFFDELRRKVPLSGK